jgi:hypothetical protein
LILFSDDKRLDTKFKRKPGKCKMRSKCQEWVIPNVICIERSQDPGDEERESREGVEAEQEQQPKWVGYRRLIKRVSMGEFIFLGVWLLDSFGLHDIE